MSGAVPFVYSWEVFGNIRGVALMTKRRVLLLTCGLAVTLVAMFGRLPVNVAAADRLAAAADEPGVLEDSDRLLRAGRSLSLGKPGVERGALSVRDPDARPDGAAGPRHLHGRRDPEQNFTYIAALRPAMAFIVDIRRGNLELASDVQSALRAIGRSRRVRVAGCSRRSGRPGSAPSPPPRRFSPRTRRSSRARRLYYENLKTIETQLVDHTRIRALQGRSRGHRIRLQRQFTVRAGHSLPVERRRRPRRSRRIPTYADLMAHRRRGQARSYLATEENFKFLKDIEDAQHGRARRRQLRRAKSAARRRPY